jgi:hypothetical protein
VDWETYLIGVLKIDSLWDSRYDCARLLNSRGGLNGSHICKGQCLFTQSELSCLSELASAHIRSQPCASGLMNRDRLDGTKSGRAISTMIEKLPQTSRGGRGWDCRTMESWIAFSVDARQLFWRCTSLARGPRSL